MASRKLGSVKLTDTIGLTPLAASDIGGGTTAQFLRGDGAWSNALTGGLALSGALIASPDNAYDIGVAPLNRFRDLIMARHGTFGGGLNLGSATVAATGELRASAGARLGAALLASTDNAYDIGASGATRFRDLYLGRDAYAAGGLNVGSATGAAAGEIRMSAGLYLNNAQSIFAKNAAGTVQGMLQRYSDDTVYLDGQGISFRTNLNVAATVALTLAASGVAGIPGGLNVGSAAGATAGEVRTSGTIYPRSATASTKLSGQTHTLADSGTAQLVPDGASMRGLVILIDQGGAVALYTLLGGANLAREISDPDGAFSPTAGTAAQWNVYWSGSRYEIQNKYGASRTAYMTFLGV